MTLVFLAVIALLFGTFQHTERSRRAEQWLRRAFGAKRWTLDQFAQAQDIDPKQCYRQLIAYLGQTPSYYRLINIEDREFQQERITAEGNAHGLIVVPADQLGATVDLFVREMDRLRMVKSSLAIKKEKVG